MTLEILASVADARGFHARQLASARIGFVPTMGALHDGHARLIAQARQECDAVVVSIFVNPIQFDRPEDLARYPRDLQRDVALCASLGVDAVFAPAVEEMYPEPLACAIDVGTLDAGLCGRFRPGHFRGVATVVMKLFQIVRPHVAYFGEKDAQQLGVIRRMVDDFNLPVHIVGVPTVRESDGLAMSSRNQRLDAEERQLATVLFQALEHARASLRDGATDTAMIATAAAATIPAHPTLRLEYLEIVEPRDFQPVTAVTGPLIIAGALWVGGTRLIDNVAYRPGEPS